MVVSERKLRSSRGASSLTTDFFLFGEGSTKNVFSLTIVMHWLLKHGYMNNFIYYCNDTCVSSHRALMFFFLSRCSENLERVPMEVMAWD